MAGLLMKGREMGFQMYDPDVITLTRDWRSQGLPEPIYEFTADWIRWRW